MELELRLSFDDGVKQDLKAAEILERYGLKGIFYIAPYYTSHQIKNLNVGEIKELSLKHEIGGHTLSHFKLEAETPKEVALKELIKGREVLMEITGQPIEKFAYCKGWFNQDNKKWVKEAGFKEARTMKRGVVCRKGYDNFEIPVSVHLYPGTESHQAIEKYREAKKLKDKGYFNLVCHSWELDKFDLWREFEIIIKYINEDINSGKNKN